MSVPIVNYRFNDRYRVTDFVTPDNPDIQQVIDNLGHSGDEFVEQVAEYIRDSFQYPVWNGNPSVDGQLLRYTQGLFKHGYKCCKFYVWAFPAEVLQSKLGYCAETANLGASLLINKVNSCVVLGDVLSTKNDTLLGRHAWNEITFKSETYVLETTIHTKGANNLTTAKGVYDKNSDWSKQGGLYYSPHARYTDKEYSGGSEFIALMGLPAKRVLLFGLEETQKVKAKQLYKELRRENAVLEKMLNQAWGVK